MTLNKAMPKVLGEGTNYMLIIPAFEFVSGAQQRDRTPGYEDEDDESSVREATAAASAQACAA